MYGCVEDMVYQDRQTFRIGGDFEIIVKIFHRNSIIRIITFVSENLDSSQQRVYRCLLDLFHQVGMSAGCYEEQIVDNAFGHEQRHHIPFDSLFTHALSPTVYI